MTPSPAGALPVLAVAALGLLGCGAGAPLLHPAHVLHAGDVSAGAGLSGEVTLTDLSASPGSDPSSASRLAQLAAAPGIAPWVGARFGIAGSNEAGLTYSGRSLRVDVRHAFAIGSAALSVGIGGSMIAAERPGQDVAGSSVFGGGVDVPLLFGVHSKSNLYALWIGPRGGFEALSGEVAVSPGQTGALVLADVKARHLFGGFVVGVRGGFRHVHVALELDGAYHRANGSIAGASTGVGMFALAPSGALILSF
ncbi:MAG: hypothetical protein ABJE95_34245 [Byssovorax sp.]